MTRRLPCYDAQNLACAKIILSDPERFGGLDGLMCRHSRLVLDRLRGKPATRPAVDERGQLRLDLERAA